jgi:hypothetical protein
MEREKEFVEQAAPEKNTDKAFVRVGEDGHPVIPEEGSRKNEQENTSGNDPRPGTLRDR